MLVLSRKRGQGIVMPDCKLAITVVAVEGNRVRLCISAPAELAVYREELWSEICRQTVSSPAEEGLGPTDQADRVCIPSTAAAPHCLRNRDGQDRFSRGEFILEWEQ